MENVTKKRKWNWAQILAIFVLITLLVSIVYAVINLISAPSGTVPEGEKTKGDYTLMLMQCILGVVVLFLPSLISKKMHFVIPNAMYIVFIIFLYCAIYLGEVQSFYYLIPNWDTILHTFSGAMLGGLGFSIVSLLNSDERVTLSMSPVFVALFACCFAVFLGVFWEFYEFTADSFGMNMQKTMLEDGTKLQGHAAVADTMSDLFVDFLGALVVAIVGYFSIRKNKKWMLNFEFKKVDVEKNKPISDKK